MEGRGALSQPGRSLLGAKLTSPRRARDSARGSGFWAKGAERAENWGCGTLAGHARPRASQQKGRALEKGLEAAEGGARGCEVKGCLSFLMQFRDLSDCQAA